MRWLYSITNSVDMNLSKLQERVAMPGRSYPACEVRGIGQEEQPHTQGVVGVRAQEGLEGAIPR